MTVYAVAQFKFTDKARYDRYAARFMDVFRNYSGKLLAADVHAEVLEGEWPLDKFVLVSFPDEAGFRAWMESPEYAEIALDRKAGTEGSVILVRGLGP